jgi:hypothetical protein
MVLPGVEHAMTRTADDEAEHGRPRLAPRRRLLAGIAAGGWLLRLSAMLIVLAGSGVGAVIWQLREEAGEDARRDSANLSIMLAEQTARAVQGIDIVLQAVMEDIDKHDWRTPGEFRRVIATERVHARLRQQLAQIPQADALSVIGADGYLTTTTRMWPMGELYLGDRDYFRHFADGGGKDIFFGQPVRNRVTDTWTIYVARRLTGPEGEFLGLVVAAVGLEWFDRVFGTINLKRDERLFLFRQDGLSLARYPAAPERVGRKLPDSSPWYGVVARGGGNYDSPGSFSGQPSLAAVSPVGAYPLFLSVLISYDAIYARWRSQATMLGSGAAILLGCAIVLMLSVRRQVQSLRQSQRTIQVRNARLAAISRELRESKDLVLRRPPISRPRLKAWTRGFF